MSASLVTRYLSEAEYPAWNELTANSPDGSIYSTTDYLKILCGEAKAQFRILVAERAGEMVGGIALFERTNSCGTYVSGRLLLYYNGFVLKAHQSKYPSERTSRQMEVLCALEDAIAQAHYGRIQIKGRSTIDDVRTFIERGWKAQPSYTYVVPLTDMDALWSRTEQNLRRLVTRCTRDGILFAEDDDFESFYRLHDATHLRKGAPIYLPEDGFRRYFQQLHARNLCRLFHARTPDGRVISSQFVLLGNHPVCHTVSAAADVQFLKTGATAFLRWKVFEHLSKMGYAANDLTDAQLNPVTHFKSQLGGDLKVNFVLDRRDSGRFLVQQLAYRTASIAKRGVMTVAASMKSAVANLNRVAPQQSVEPERMEQNP